jgi:hypothetical protein
MTEIVERLREAHANSAQRIFGSDIFEAAADLIEQQAASLAAKDAEIERLRAVDTRTSLLTVIADIREKSSVGGKPMLDELADEIAGKIAAAESRAEQAERAFNREQDNIYASFDKWSKALGWGLTGNQPECWALMDSAVEELVGKRTALAEARTELGETQLVLEQTERNAARVIAEAITVIQQGESATNAAYCQAMAEYHGHDKTADKHDRTVTAFRHAARAFVAQHGSDSREGK